MKMFLVKGEHGRLLNDMYDLKFTIRFSVNQLTLYNRANVKKMYSNVLHENKALISELDKRTNNHKELLKALREVNNMINKAANLRFGKFKSKVVSLCRSAIK